MDQPNIFLGSKNNFRNVKIRIRIYLNSLNCSTYANIPYILNNNIVTRKQNKCSKFLLSQQALTFIKGEHFWLIGLFRGHCSLIGEKSCYSYMFGHPIDAFESFYSEIRNCVYYNNNQSSIMRKFYIKSYIKAVTTLKYEHFRLNKFVHFSRFNKVHGLNRHYRPLRYRYQFLQNSGTYLTHKTYYFTYFYSYFYLCALLMDEFYYVHSREAISHLPYNIKMHYEAIAKIISLLHQAKSILLVTTGALTSSNSPTKDEMVSNICLGKTVYIFKYKTQHQLYTTPKLSRKKVNYMVRNLISSRNHNLSFKANQILQQAGRLSTIIKREVSREYIVNKSRGAACIVKRFGCRWCTGPLIAGTIDLVGPLKPCAKNIHYQLAPKRINKKVLMKIKSGLYSSDLVWGTPNFNLH